MTGQQTTPPLVEQLRDLALDVAVRAGALLHSGQPGARQVGAKSSPTDVVTQMDTAAEELIVGEIRGHRPADGVLGEESGERAGTSGVRWVIDPLDGTVNYLYGLPLWCVSVAVEVDGRAVAGAVAAPALGEWYHGTVGGGSWLRDASGAERRLVGREPADLDRALVATGFGYRPERRAAQAAIVAGLLPGIRDIRRCGAAALDLCWLAAGRYDAYYERGLQPWDAAAGVVIAREAGLTVTGGATEEPDGDLIVAAGPYLQPPLRAALVEQGAHIGD